MAMMMRRIANPTPTPMRSDVLSDPGGRHATGENKLFQRHNTVMVNHAQAGKKPKALFIFSHLQQCHRCLPNVCHYQKHQQVPEWCQICEGVMWTLQKHPKTLR